MKAVDKPRALVIGSGSGTDTKLAPSTTLGAADGVGVGVVVVGVVLVTTTTSRFLAGTNDRLLGARLPVEMRRTIRLRPCIDDRRRSTPHLSVGVTVIDVFGW